MARKLSRREAHRLALHHAIAERDSFADANRHCADGIAEKAQGLADEFRRVLMDEFGEKTWEDSFAAQNHPSVDIRSLVDPQPKDRTNDE